MKLTELHEGFLPDADDEFRREARNLNKHVMNVIDIFNTSQGGPKDPQHPNDVIMNFDGADRKGVKRNLIKAFGEPRFYPVPSGDLWIQKGQDKQIPIILFDDEDKVVVRYD